MVRPAQTGIGSGLSLLNPPVGRCPVGSLPQAAQPRASTPRAPRRRREPDDLRLPHRTHEEQLGNIRPRQALDKLYILSSVFNPC